VKAHLNNRFDLKTHPMSSSLKVMFGDCVNVAVARAAPPRVRRGLRRCRGALRRAVQFQPSDSSDHPVAKSSPRRKRTAPSVAKSLPTTPLSTAARLLSCSPARLSPHRPRLLSPPFLHEILARTREGERIRGYAGCRGVREFYGGGCKNCWRIYSSHTTRYFPS
jgi:hypothetical protein